MTSHLVHLRIGAFLSGVVLAGCLPLAGGAYTLTNSMGLEFVQVPSGTFEMGQAKENCDRDLCYTETPAHAVRITQPFHVGVTEVTMEQYRRFKPEFEGTKECLPFAAGVSWHDAVAYCEWLSKREGKPYRLPTEAEWEYAARQAGTLGISNVFSEPLEWCLDCFGDYSEQGQTDPVGLDHGLARVVRGGCLDQTKDVQDYAHPSHRGGMAPGFGTYPGAPGELGRHRIGFRVVQAAMPDTRPRAAQVSFIQQGIQQSTAHARQGPDPGKPYLRKRHLLPVPPDNAPTPAIDALGLHPSFRRHNHSPALTVCPNGDVLMVTYTSYREYEPEVSLMATRLRFGAEEWDMPEPFVDFPAVNEHAPMLFTDRDTVRLCWGNPRLPGAFPFQWIESRDNGATWSEVQFPSFQNAPGLHSRQPINSGFRGKDGTLYVASDGEGGTSVLWTSTDDGRTWRDPGSRSAGRHTTYCLLKDGGILGMGGKNTDIEGFMPVVVSRDGGKTWEKSKSVFPAQANNQRPSLLRLQSGRLFFASDFQDIHGKRPAGVTHRGSYVALSEDDGQTWHIKKLAGTQPHEVKGALKGADTLGYSAAAQAPNGMIHLITSMNHPCLHFEMNEAWILSPEADDPGDAVLMKSAATKVAAVKTGRENHPNGTRRLEASGGVADDGRYLRHGRETRFHPNGKKQYEATYHLGHKTGKETLWCSDGTVEWQWEHRKDGVRVWTQFWPNGSKKAESHWRGKFAHGPAVLWDADGQETSRLEFSGGEAARMSQGRSQRAIWGARAGARPYVDRDFQIVSLPPELVGGDLVRTANEDDYSTDKNHLTLELSGPATVYVCYWAEAQDLPGWLKEPGWKRMPGQAQVEILGARKAYNIFARSAPKGRLMLGGNERGKTGAASMYFVVIGPDGKPASATDSSSGVMKVSPADRPNILFILADDLGWGDMAFHGGNAPTPNLDRLAREGLELTRHYVGPMCTPTRASLMTGQRWSRFGVAGPENRRILPWETLTLPRALKLAGYETCLTGKWHLGSLPEEGPHHFGFDHAYGSLAGGVSPWIHRYKQGPYTRTWHRNGQLIEESGHVTTLIANEAIQWLQSRGDAPFFLYVPFTAVHLPVKEPAEWLARVPKTIQGDVPRHYAASIMHLDDAVGRLLAALEATGKRDRTLVVFTSDNGGNTAENDGPDYPEDKIPKGPLPGNNLPWRGKKGDLYEGGVRVPTIVSWPGRVKPGRLDIPIHVTDWMPTFCALAGVQPTGESPWDGVDLTALLTRHRSLPERPLYAVGLNWRSRSLHLGEWKLIVHGEGGKRQMELFHLGRDPAETDNRATAEPDRLAVMSKQLDALAATDRRVAP